MSESGITPHARRDLSPEELDDLKRRIALAVVRDFTPRQIAAQILANLHLWKEQAIWVSAYDEWQALALGEDEGALLAAMLGRDENAVRLRHTMPFFGLLTPEELGRLHDEATR